MIDMKKPIKNLIFDKDKPVYSTEINNQREEILNSDFVNAVIEAKKERRKNDPYFPFYHYINGFGFMNDPNGLCYWNGRWHLFYQQFYTDEKGNGTTYWGHAVSKNMLEWVELPFAIYPGLEEECWSGATVVEKDIVTALYYGKGGNFEGLYGAVSNDPFLLNWTKTTNGPCLEKEVKNLRSPHCLYPKECGNQPYNVFDPFIFKEDDTYYAITGGVRRQPVTGAQMRNSYLFSSKDAKNWEYIHEFLDDNSFTAINDDGACPYFVPIEDMHLLIYYSHINGAKYLYGKFDKKNLKFLPANGGAFNHTSQRGGYCAPSAFPADENNVKTIFVMHSDNQLDAMSLPHTLRIGGSDREKICILPPENTDILHIDNFEIKNIELTANEEYVLPKEFSGNAIEMDVLYSAKNVPCLELRLARSDDGSEYTSICFYNERGGGIFGAPDFPLESVISVDCSHSSKCEKRMAPPENRRVLLQKDALKLKIFFDRSVLEVFINDEEVIGRCIFPDPNSIKISLVAHGNDTVVDQITLAHMKDINTEFNVSAL